MPEANPFLTRMHEVFGIGETDRILAASTRRAIRVNPFKTTAAKLQRRLTALGMRIEHVPFAAPGEAFFVEDPAERSLGLTWEHQAGHFFGQDAASLLPVMALDPQRGERILDLCAAPGGKATHIAARMGGEGLVVANDAKKGRFNNMVSNLDRFGALNVVATRRDGARTHWPFAFDRVLVDAPCSNLGSAHASEPVQRRFHEALVRRLTSLQRSLLVSAFRATKVGGVLVYATCTLEPAENEAVASWFAGAFPVAIEPFDPGVGRPGLTGAAGERYRDDVAGARRVHPGDMGSDGFFCVGFRKLAEEPRLGKPRASRHFEHAPGVIAEVAATYGLDEERLEGATAVRTSRRSFLARIPDLDAVLALDPERVGVYFAVEDLGELRLGFDAATLLGTGAKKTLPLTEDSARGWLAGETVDAPDIGGMGVVTCEGEVLGCGRSFKGRMPSFVPKERRVPRDGDLLGFLAAK